MRYIIIIFVTTCVFAACSEDKFTTYVPVLREGNNGR